MLQYNHQYCTLYVFQYLLLYVTKPGREGPVSVMDFGENPWDDFNYRPIVDIVANKKSVYKWF